MFYDRALRGTKSAEGVHTTKWGTEWGYKVARGRVAHPLYPFPGSAPDACTGPMYIYNIHLLGYEILRAKIKGLFENWKQKLQTKLKYAKMEWKAKEIVIPRDYL